MGQDLYFYGWVGGWVGGDMEIKANLSQSLVEVEADFGNRAWFEVNRTFGCREIML